MTRRLTKQPANEPAEPPIDVSLIVITTVSVAVGIVLRFLPRSGLWLDEALSANIAGLPISEIPTALRHDGHPPLYYVLLHVWSSAFGTSDWAVRAMSGVISTLSLPLSYVAGRRVASREGAGPLDAHRTGLIVLAVTAAMPFGVRYGAEARMYALVMFLCWCGYLLVDDLLRGSRIGGKRLATAGGATAVAAALLWTHYWSIWLLATLGIFALWRSFSEADQKRRGGARLLVGSLIGGGILFLPWVPNLLYQSSHTGTPWGDSFGPVSVLVLSLVDFAGGRFGIAQLFSYLVVVLVLIAFFVTIRVRRDGHQEPQVDSELLIEPWPHLRVRSEMVIFLGTLAIGWAAAAVSGNTFSTRYTSVVYPVFLVCVGVGVAVLRRPLQTSAVLAVVVLVASFGAFGAARSDRSQNGEIAAAIVSDSDEVAHPIAVIACPDQLGVSLQRELDQRVGTDRPLDVIPYPTGGDPHFVDWVDYGERNKDSSPKKFLTTVADRIPEDATIYLVSSPHYRTFEGQCESLADSLSHGRSVTHAVSLDDSGLDESADLWILRPNT